MIAIQNNPLESYCSAIERDVYKSRGLSLEFELKQIEGLKGSQKDTISTQDLQRAFISIFFFFSRSQNASISIS